MIMTKGNLISISSESEWNNQCFVDADLDSAFYLNADPDHDPGNQTNVDPCDLDPGQTSR